MGQGRKVPYWVIAIAILAQIMLFAALVLTWWLDCQPIGTGETRASPDGRYRASVHDFQARKFWTGEQLRWFEFTISGPGIDHSLRSSPLPGPYFGSRPPVQVIFWQPDSSSVRFVFPTSELRFDMAAD